jgi:hypothetical protein
MKEFDLDAALNGEPVILRNGEKAVVKYNLLNEVEKLEVRDAEHPLIGYRFDGIYINTTSWSLTGKSVHWNTMEYDIIGMWEEPKLTSEQVLEKAYQENLPLDAIGKKAFVIAKTKDGDYVMQCGEDNLYFASNKIEWKFYKDPVPKSDTITNTISLPKPFYPKECSEYFYILDGKVTYNSNYYERNIVSRQRAINGQCFRTAEDAQKWLDFMKSMME